MIVEMFPVGLFQCNCIILGCDETHSAIVIDPGEEGDRIVETLKRQGLTAISLLHTHAHFDHIGGTVRVREQTGAVAALHEDDMGLYEKLPEQTALFDLPDVQVPTIDRWIKDGDTFAFGRHAALALHTPGHTQGSTSFYIADFGLATGDTLFAGSVGRTDLWGGSHPTLIQSIHKKLLAFPDDTRIYPGHGRHTTVGQERRTNPFL